MDAQKDIHRLHRLAYRQAGRIKRSQLYRLGIERGQIASWVARGILIPCVPSVFAVGHAVERQAGW